MAIWVVNMIKIAQRPRFEEEKLRDVVALSEWEYHIRRVYKEYKEEREI